MMLDYLEKFNNLDKEVREKVTTSEVMEAVSGLEKKYGVNLATIIMRVMIKDLQLSDLVKYFVFEFNLNETKAQELVNELKNKIFKDLEQYLGIQQVTATQPKGWTPQNKEGVWGSDNFFADEEEEEIRKLTKKLDGEVKENLDDTKIEQRLDKIMNEVQINFGSEELAARFRRILKIYLRGIRDKIDTKQTLMKPIEAGGLGFDQDSVDQVIQVVDGDREKMDKILLTAPKPEIKPEKEKVLEKSEKDDIIKAQARDIDYDLEALKKQGIEGGGTEIIKDLDTKHEIAPPPPKLRQADLQPAISQKVADETPPSMPSASAETKIDEKAPEQLLEKPVLKPKPDKKAEVSPESKFEKPASIEQEEKSSAIQDIAELKKTVQDKKAVQEIKQIDARKKHHISGKIKMDDVKFIPKTMGPIEELGFMDLISFRRIDNNPEQAIEKIKEKISLLEEEGYAKRLEGIKAWRTSPINKLYLEMGQTSIVENKPIDTIIEERGRSGKEYLYAKEFEAITDLNRDLRF